MRSVARGLYVTLLALVTVAGLLSNTSPKASAVQHTPVSMQEVRAFALSIIPTPHVTKPKPVVVKPAVAVDPIPEPHVVAHVVAHVVGADYNIGNPLWQTWHTDPTAYEPSASDPIRQLPYDAQVKFACIRYVESRNHPNSVNPSSGTEGLYQFQPYLWQYGAKALGIPASNAIYATPEQQSAVAAWFYKRNGGFYPEWQDGC